MSERFKVISRMGETEQSGRSSGRFKVLQRADDREQTVNIGGTAIPSTYALADIAFKNPSALPKSLQSPIDSATRIPSRNYNAQIANAVKTKEIPLEDRALLESAKAKYNAGGYLTASERAAIGKYGFSYILPDKATAEFDIAAKSNPQNRARIAAAQRITDKRKSGGALTKAEEDILATVDLINGYNKSVARQNALVTSDPNKNAAKIQSVKAYGLYNDAAYTGDTIKIGNTQVPVDENSRLDKTVAKAQRAGNRASLYINTGMGQYIEGAETTVNLLLGKTNLRKEAVRADNAYSMANACLREYYGQNGEAFNRAVQDIVTNIANNAPGMLAGAVTKSRLAGTAAFGLSVFGNAYTEAAKLGTESNGRALAYAFASTASECVLEYLLGGIPKVGGVLSGEIISDISEKLSSVIKKAAVKIAGNAAGEFIEEGTQSLLSPLLQKYIIGIEDTETVFDNPLDSLSAAAYEGFIGAVSSALMGGVGSFTEASGEVSLQKNGAYYKNIFGASGIDIRNIAKYFDEVSDKRSTLKKAAGAVANGNTSDLAAGIMMAQVAETVRQSNTAVFERIGKSVINSRGGVSTALSAYESVVSQGGIFPEKVTALYNTVKADPDAASPEVLGELALSVQTYAPRAEIIGELLKSANLTFDNKTGAGYNNDRGEENGLSDKGRLYENNGGRQDGQQNAGANSQNGRARAESQGEFIRRTQGIAGRGGSKERLLLKKGNSLLAYTEKSHDNSNAGVAARMLEDIGIRAVYCDGDIETNENGVTVRHGEALTTEDGEVYVSSNATLSAEEIAYHETVHVNDRKSTKAYSEYESVICENILYGSKVYEYICTQINDNHYGGRYDVESTDTAKKFVREITAYVNQFVMTDPQFAERTFAAMFDDWDAVVEAVHKFNEDTGAEFNSQTEITGDDGDERVFDQGRLGEESRDYARGEEGRDGSASQVRRDVQRRTGGIAPQNQRRRIVNYKKSNVNYSEAAADDSDGYKAYTAFRNAGINAEFNAQQDERRIVNFSPEQHRAAILRYKSGESYYINTKLREDIYLSETEQEFVDTLDEALSQLSAYEGTVYRNLTFDDFGGEEAYSEFLERHVPNKIIIYDQFISCSKAHDGYPVEGKYKIQLVVQSKSARDVDGYGNNMESEVIYPLKSTFAVDRIDNSGAYPVIYLQEVLNDGYHTVEEQSDAMRHLQELYTENGGLQGVSEGNTVGNFAGSIRPQSAASERQRNTVRTRGGQETVLSAESREQGEEGLSFAYTDTEFWGDDGNDEDNARGNAGSGQERKTADTRTESQIESKRQGAEGTLQRRATQAIKGSGRRYVLKLNEGTDKEIAVTYIGKYADNSEAYRAVEILKSKGYDVEYCDGSIYLTDNNGKISQHNNAVTTQNGKILVSSKCLGTAEQTADHEEVHLLQRKNHKAFIEYESVICDNIAFDSDAYLEIAQKINKDHFGVERVNKETGKTEKTGGYSDEELLETAVMRKMLNEILAYLRQCYNYDADLAKQSYGDLFENWDEVAGAIERLNDSVGRNNVTDTAESESFFEEPSAEFPEYDFIKDEGARLAGVERHSEGQKQIIEIGRRLGYKVIFDPKLKAQSGAFANGKIDRDNKTIYINPKAKRVKQWIIKHELVHYGNKTEAYIDYAAAVKKSDEFFRWLKAQGLNGDDATTMLAELRQRKAEAYARAGAPIGAAKADEEIMGDFSGDVIFSNDEAGINRLLKGLDEKEHNVIVRFILDFVSFLKEKFTGNKQLTLELKRLEALYTKMLREAKNNPAAQSEGVDYAINYPYFTVAEIRENSVKLQKMKSVKHLSGNEFPKSDIPLQKRILNFFDKIGNNVYSEVFGDVALNNSAVHDDLGHGRTNNKIIAFAAVPEVIRQGVVIDMQRRGNGNYDRIVVAAPIEIGNTDFAMGVMLQRDHQSQRLVLHDVVVINKEETSQKSETAPSTTEVSENNESLYMTNILQKALSVNTNSTLSFPIFQAKGRDSNIES